MNPKTTGALRVPARAKLTLSLRVIGVRRDGYHELDAEMVELDLADELVIEPEGDGVTFEFDGPSGVLAAGPENLVVRALAAVGRRAGVHVMKRIPVGGGLGGGSADAAAVLRWAGCRDLDVALSLGADVPFCLVGGRARIGGIGERVEPLAPEARSFVLLLPPLAVETAAVYRAWDSLDEQRRRSGAGGNDLEAAALAVEPALARWRDVLAEATGTAPRLAGSGSTWFVEGAPEDLGLGGVERLEIDGGLGTLRAVRTAAPPDGGTEKDPATSPPGAASASP